MEITELIDAAAQAAVENEPPTLSEAEFCRYFGTHRRTDGLFAVTDKIVNLFFPPEEDAETIRQAQVGVFVNGENIQTTPNIFPHPMRRESAFRQFNYAALTAAGEKPVAARALINAAIESGNIN